MLDFPNSPTNGQLFTAPNGTVWQWDTAKWFPANAGTAFLPLSGGTMQGDLVLKRDPVAALGAATKEYADAGLVTAEAYADASVNANAYGGFVNKLRNGTFGVQQRGAGGPAALGFTYAFDGWQIGAQGAAVTWGTQNGRGPTLNAMYISGAAGNTAVSLNAKIESNVAAPLGGVPATFQLQIFNNSGASITPTLTIQHASARDNFATGVVDVGSVNLQPCPNNAWTRVAYTFTVPAASVNLGLMFTIQFGALVASQAVAVCEADLRATPGLPVGLCANPPPPELRPITTELTFCQRYYVQPGIGVVANNYASVATISAYANWEAPVVMRSSPTLVATWGSGVLASAGPILMLTDNRTVRGYIQSTQAGNFNSTLTITSLSAEL